MGNSRYDYALWSNSKHVKIYLTPCHNVETSSPKNISMFSIARHFPFDRDIIYTGEAAGGGGGVGGRRWWAQPPPPPPPPPPPQGDGGHSSPFPHAPRFSAIFIVSKA